MDAECEEHNDLGESNIGERIIKESNEKIVAEVEDNHVPSSDENAIDGETCELEKTKLDNNKTSGSQTASQKAENVTEVTRNADQVYENGKRKIKEEKPPTKVVVRRLPPLMTKETFLEQVSPIPQYDYFYFVNGDPSYGVHSFSRAYLNFINQEDVFTFTQTFDNYVFLDGKGQEYPAIVEFSPFQRVPKLRSKKKDTLTGSIESDPIYISFKDNLLAEALENSKPGAKTMKQHYFETEISTAEEINTTPLLEFLKQRRAEKARIRDERREEKKRKEAERKLKQKAKEKKLDGDEEETKDVKVLQSKDRKDGKDKDIKMTKKKEDKDKLLKETRTREFKNRSGKSYQEERIRQAERREERKKEVSNTSFERKSESQYADGKEHERSNSMDIPVQEERAPRPFIEKKRMFEIKKKNDIDDWKGEGDGDKRVKTDRNRGERRQRERERKRREEFASRKGFDKKVSEIEKKKTKPYKSYQLECNETKDTMHGNDRNRKSGESDENATAESLKKNVPKDKPLVEKEMDTENKREHNLAVSQRRKSLESGSIITDNDESDKTDVNLKRRNSLESGNVKTNFSSETSSNCKGNGNNPRNKSSDVGNKNGKEVFKSDGSNFKKFKISPFPIFKEDEKKQQDNGQYPLQSKDISRTDEGTHKTNESKNSDVSCHADTSGSARSKDPRTDRRIRNKDRPSLQIYRPGMGKFSKQRLEKEKVLGSSTEVESPSHSPSPTPKVKFPS